MITIYEEKDAIALTDLELRDLVVGHPRTAKERGLQDLTCIAVLEEDDDLDKELGFTPLHNPLTGLSYGQEGFEPHWDWLEVHSGWFELIYTVGDSGFAFILFVRDGPVAELCRRQGRGRQTGNLKSWRSGGRIT